MRQITKRLLSGQDLRKEIQNVAKDQKVSAGTILSLVGNLTYLRIRVADGKTVQTWNDSFEIVSGVGTVSENDCHIHLAVSDQEGNVFGGHLKEGCIIGTTDELVILVFDDVKYKRAPDVATGYDELVIE